MCSNCAPRRRESRAEGVAGDIAALKSDSVSWGGDSVS
jgi:hypothetical protein